MFARFKAHFFAWCMLLVLFTGSAHAELVAIPPIKNRVTDLTQTLSPDQQAQLEAKLSQFEQQKGSQVAILMVPTTQPEDIAQYSIRVVDAWKLGREKQDDGLLILVAKNDRKMRIEVGYGLEGPIPDLIAKRIISEVMAPKFRQGDYYGGLNDATDVVMRLISGEQLPAPAQTQNHAGGISGMLPLLLIGSLVLGGILRGIFGSFFGGALTGGAIGMLAWILGGGLLLAIIFGIVAFFVTMMGAFGLGQLGGLGGFGGGYGGGGRDIFSGGGGGFGGGGASGDW
jgi:uncharacterized protein